ncbi:MAG TPA: hypothetical protein PKE47_10860 [Verrucomicrobiota bacterium]|nr:hypothetical protein [Verrucomicrobiota bacterium]
MASRAAGFLALLALAGCAIQPFQRGGGRHAAAQQELTLLQGGVQRFADEFLARTTGALDEYVRRAGTPDAQSQTLAWKLPLLTAAVGIASGPNPAANALDLITLATVTRLAVEAQHERAEHPAAFEPWLEVSRSLEADAWVLAEGVFNAGQRGELRTAIQRWWEAYPDARGVFFARPQELTKLVRETGELSGRPLSIFGFVGLDPTAGLDPAVQEVTRTRLFAERTLFTAQRMPFLLRWHVELLGDQFLRQSQVAQALTNTAHLAQSAERVGRAAESASATLAELPDRVAAERAAILAAFEAQEGRLRDLSAEVGRTLVAGERMSASLHATIVTFDALMRRFGIGEPERPGARDADAPPFDILDYARTAEQLTEMAREMNALLRATEERLDSPALGRGLAELDRLAARTRADAKSVLNHAFLLGAALVLLAFGCALAHRRLGAAGRT